ncbi:MAG: hypothetical protein U1A27_09970 [Phycisphaerae bacterium]
MTAPHSDPAAADDFAWAPLSARLIAPPDWLADTTLATLGHSRRILAEWKSARLPEAVLLRYSFEAGFGVTRVRHERLILGRWSTAGSAPIVIASDECLAAAAMRPGFVRRRVSDRWCVAADGERLDAGRAALEAWLAPQPLELAWELRADAFCGHAPGAAPGPVANALARALAALPALSPRGD